MLTIKDESKFRQKIKLLCLNLFNKLENNGNSDFQNNGEENFIKEFFSTYKEKEIIVFDVGANTGLYVEKILEVAKKFSSLSNIHAFEPTYSCWESLQEKFGNYQNIKLNQFGISDTEGQASIYYDRETSGLASLYQRNLKVYNINLSQQETIKLRRLDDYIEDNNIQHINLLKIDIEGHELFALKSLGNFLNGTFIDAIQFEYGGTNLDSRVTLMEICELLNNTGFALYKIMPKYLEKRNYQFWMENFQYSNYVALSKVYTNYNNM